VRELNPFEATTVPPGKISQDATCGTRSRKTTRNRLLRSLRTIVPGAIGLSLFALAWQLLAAHYAVRTANAFPSIGAIWTELSANLSMYGIDAAHTLEEVTIGLGASFIVAFTLAVVMTHVPIIERMVMPLAVILNVTPVVAIAPGLTLMLGLGMSPRYVVTALIVFFPLLINSLVGLGNIDPEALDLFHTMHASRKDVLLHLRLPSSLPFLFVAARICFPLATVGAVVAEFSTSGPGTGLGSAIAVAVASDAVPAVYAAIFCLAVMGLALTIVVALTERRLLTWHPSSRLTSRER
jgi:NitT/TauT family transport system permease protein